MIIQITEPRTPCMTIQPLAEIVNLLDNLEQKAKLNLVKELGFTKDIHHPKYGRSGWYARIIRTSGSGIILPNDQIISLGIDTSTK
ncbi:MAG: hypothetical protein AABX38_08350 [Candidatus Micrarchaeota archaeon]